VRDPGAMQRQANFLHTSHGTLHTPHFTLHTPHFISSQIMCALLTSSHLISSHHIPSLLTYHLIRQVLLNWLSSHPSTGQPITSPQKFSQLISADLHARKLLLSERSPLNKKPIGSRKFLHTNTWDTDAFRQKTLSEILCATKLAQSISQYSFVLQSLHKGRPSTTTCATKLA
jgi:hypothetical protein